MRHFYEIKNGKVKRRLSYDTPPPDLVNGLIEDSDPKKAAMPLEWLEIESGKIRERAVKPKPVTVKREDILVAYGVKPAKVGECLRKLGL